MKYVSCNLCGADKPRLITVQNNYKIVQCNNCGLVFVNPMPDPEMLSMLYEGYHQRDGKNNRVWERLMERNFREVSSFLNKCFPAKGEILDIGCGYGHFIEFMRDHGWSVSGIDPSSRTLNFARGKGLNVFETTLENALFPDNSFDAITAFYVLEHLPDPISALKKIFVMLKPGGVLVIRIPHTTPIVWFLSIFKIKNNLYDPPFHLYDFSPETITLLLKKAGFSSIEVVPGSPTLPEKYIERIISIFSGNLSKLLFFVTAGRFLLPGVSKTIIANKIISKQSAVGGQHSIRGGSLILLT